MALLQQFCPNPSEVLGCILVEWCELFFELSALFSLDGLVVVTGDFDVVLPELSLISRHRRHFLHLQKNATHQVNTKNVGESHTKADSTQRQKLEGLILVVSCFPHELLEIPSVFEDRMNTRKRPQQTLIGNRFQVKKVRLGGRMMNSPC